MPQLFVLSAMELAGERKAYYWNRWMRQLLSDQCSPMAVGPSDISGNDWLGPINSSPAADRMSDEIFRANLVFLAEI